MTDYRYNYESPLKEYFYAFLDHKALVNQDVFSYAFLFKHVDNFLVERKYNKRYINREIYQEWLEQRISSVSPVTSYRESTMMRTFLIYTSDIGNECYIPILKIKPKKNYIAYVFSNEELQKLFAASDHLRLKNRCVHNIVHMRPALFRLLYSTGMRLGEALELRNRDVNLTSRIIKLRKTKNNRERIAPINTSLLLVLEEYVCNRNRIPTAGIAEPNGYFFCGAKGQKAQQTTTRYWFHLARSEAGIPYYGRSSGPTIHSLRHTACVHALMKMVKAGRDPYCCLPILTAFMGHRDVKDTEYYLHMCEELYPDIIQLDNKISSGINTIITNAVRYNHHENE